MSLTDDWKAGKLEDGLYYILLENGKTPISELETWYRTNIEESKEYYETEQAFYGYSDNMISEVLAPVPTYGEYRSMQAELAEHRHYCCCAKNEKLQLDKDELEEEIAELLADNKKMQEQVVRLNKYIEQWQKAYQNTVTENCSVKNECAGLRALLKECRPYLSYKINKDKRVGFTPTAANLLTRINAAIGESED